MNPNTPKTNAAFEVAPMDHGRKMFHTCSELELENAKMKELIDMVYDDMCGRIDGKPTRKTALAFYKFNNQPARI